jgi:hypothetical protein
MKKEGKNIKLGWLRMGTSLGIPHGHVQRAFTSRHGFFWTHVGRRRLRLAPCVSTTPSAINYGKKKSISGNTPHIQHHQCSNCFYIFYLHEVSFNYISY